MRVLVTGGAGFIGSHVVRELMKSHEVIILDNFSTGNNFFDCETITDDLVTIKSIPKTDWVIHLAALTDVDRSYLFPMEYYRNNILGTINLLKYITNQKFTFASSSGVYDKTINPYAMTKIVGEHYVKKLKNYVILRFFNVFGEWERMTPWSASVIRQFIFCAKRNLPLIIDGSGRQKRDFVYVGDIVKGIMQAEHGTYDLGTGVQYSINRVAKLIVKYAKSKSKIAYGKARVNEVMEDVSPLGVPLSWKPLPFTKMLKKTIAFYG